MQQAEREFMCVFCREFALLEEELLMSEEPLYVQGFSGMGLKVLLNVHILDIQWLKLQFSHMWTEYNMGRYLQFISSMLILGCNANMQAFKGAIQLIVILIILLLRIS